MARIGDVWDSTVDAARGRAGMIAPVALLAFGLPSLVQGGAALALPAGSGIVTLLGLVALLATIWGQLAILAITTDPATTRAEALRQANARLPAALGVTALLCVAAVALLLVPLFVIAVGADWERLSVLWTAMNAAGPARMPVNWGDLAATIPGWVGTVVALYVLALGALGLWVSARVTLLLNAVVLNERRGIGAIGRAIDLTRGLTWKLIGVLLLYGLVLLVVLAAVQMVTFLLIRLPFGAGAAVVAGLVSTVAGALVTALLTALFCVFAARLYVATARAGAKDVQPLR